MENPKDYDIPCTVRLSVEHVETMRRIAVITGTKRSSIVRAALDRHLPMVLAQMKTGKDGGVDVFG